MNPFLPNEPATDRPYEGMAIRSDVLFRNCLGSVTFALTLLDELEASGLAHVESIANHATAADYESIVEAAHSLKGAAGIIGAETLQMLTAKIESAGKMSDMGSIHLLVGDIRQEMARCLDQIHLIRQKTQSETT